MHSDGDYAGDHERHGGRLKPLRLFGRSSFAHAPQDMRSNELRGARGQTLIEVLIALLILTVLFVFVSGDLAAITSGDSAADQTLEISAANYYLGIMKSDPNFWATDWGTGQNDPCGNQLFPYIDVYPSPPATPAPDQWHQFQYCSTDGAFKDPNGQPETFQYMWNATPDTNDPLYQADLTIWIRRDAASKVFEYHGIRYRTPTLQTPPPYPTATPAPTGSPTTPPSPTPKPSATPRPTPKPTPSHPPTPKPSPTPIGV
jgi:prepilin-type N-terminal cleavage/methylation domain-containing protein